MADTALNDTIRCMSNRTLFVVTHDLFVVSFCPVKRDIVGTRVLFPVSIMAYNLRVIRAPHQDASLCVADTLLGDISLFLSTQSVEIPNIVSTDDLFFHVSSFLYQHA